MKKHLRVLRTLFVKDIVDMFKNPNVLLMLALPLIFIVIYQFVDLGMSPAYLLMLGVMMNLCLTPLSVLGMMIAEEKEKNTMRTLMLCNVKSLAVHVACDERYRIIVMCDNVKNITMIQLRNVIKDYENIDIEFVDIRKKMYEYSESFGQTVTDRQENRLYSGEFTLTIYFRLFIAELFPELNKAVYIDSDTVINDDIAKLYSVDMGDAMFGAVRDTFAGKNTILAHYIENVVGIERNEYVNSGVLLMNLDKIRQAHLADRFLKLMAEYHFDSVAPDQDYINAMCAKEIYFLDKEWNVMPNKGGEYIARPKLIHYNLFDKPWHYSEIPYEEYFWQYAAESGFYPLLIKQRKQYGDNEKKADRENLKKLLARAENIADGDGVKFSDVVGSRFVVDSGFVKDSSDAAKK